MVYDRSAFTRYRSLLTLARRKTCRATSGAVRTPVSLDVSHHLHEQDGLNEKRLGDLASLGFDPFKRSLVIHL
jgi:hypothetical protein